MAIRLVTVEVNGPHTYVFVFRAIVLVFICALSDLPSEAVENTRSSLEHTNQIVLHIASGKLFLEVHYSQSFNPELILNSHFLCGLQISASHFHTSIPFLLAAAFML